MDDMNYQLKYPFKMYDWDSQKFRVIPITKIVDAIHYAWNYEFDVYDRETDKVILAGRESNEINSELLEPYGLRLVDRDGFRVLQDIETDEIFKPDWQ